MSSSPILFSPSMQPFFGPSRLSWSLMQSFLGCFYPSAFFKHPPPLCMVPQQCLIHSVSSTIILRVSSCLLQAFFVASSRHFHDFFRLPSWFLQGIFSSLSNPKAPSNLHLEFKEVVRDILALIPQAQVQSYFVCKSSLLLIL